ncbi:MAG: efflux RND transporter periplasmic adaptor subunit [Lachnospiraceae bacterium]|nr:efflux RND transporter periplasmic adaptor subunit [Lachnospiraceae bacterium]MDE7201659.1 efflux RND transporter periplasmic adaptor subunit [Lachnospiraceae bacterium]
MKKGHFILTAAVVGIICMGITVVTIIYCIKNNKEEDIAYHEEAVEYGIFTVGITKTAPISLSVVEQTFDLDIGAWTGEASAALQIEEVLVSAGQQVQKGTALFRVTPESVQNVRSILQKKVFDANRDCEVLKAKQKELRLLASQGYDSDIVNGKYADVVYGSKCDELQKKADDAKEAVDDKQNQVNENLLELTQTQQELAKAQKYLKEAEAAVSENYDNRYNDAYYYTVYQKTRETAENMVNQLEEQVKSLTKKNELLLFEVDEAVRTYHKLVQELEKEKLVVKMDYDTELYDSSIASEWYDIQTLNLDSALQEARERYLAALQNIQIFNAYIVHNRVRSQYNGILSDIMTKTGDTVSKNDRLVTLYDQEAVTMEVSLSEEDYLAVNQDELVKISFADHPDEVYEGRITEISNKEYDNGSEKLCYIVKVNIQGGMSGFYEGMTGDVTFWANERRKALYVPNKAVYTEGARSYVKMRNKKGDVVKKNVTTGFSDGNYVEITKGISEGDMVLIELH